MGVIYSQGSASGEPVIDATSCLLCGDCAHICPVGVLTQNSNAIHIDADAAFGCIACGHCMMVCPTDSIQVHGRRLQPSDLVELPGAETKASAEQLESLFLGRRSIRHFSSADIPREVIERIVSAAAAAPMGVPPWDVGLVIFHGRESVRQLAWDTADTYKGLLKFMDHRISMALFRLFTKKKTWQALDTFILPLG
jgi:ferredoxin